MIYERIEKVNAQAYATTLAGFLATISTIAFAILGASSLNKETPLILIFTAIGLLATFGVALLSDYVLDKAEVTEKERVTLFGGGYLIFSLLMGLLTFGLLFLLGHDLGLKNSPQIIHVIISVITGVMLVAKEMTKDPQWPLWWLFALLPISFFMPLVMKVLST